MGRNSVYPIDILIAFWLLNVTFRTNKKRSDKIQCVFKKIGRSHHCTLTSQLVELKKDPGVPRLPDLKQKKNVQKQEATKVPLNLSQSQDEELILRLCSVPHRP